MRDELYDLARQSCTPKQFDAWRLEAVGMSQRNIALVLGISRSAARARLDDAHSRIAFALTIAGPGTLGYRAQQHRRAESDGLSLHQDGAKASLPAATTTTGDAKS